MKYKTTRDCRKCEAACSANRFHIDVRSETFTVGDMEWAQILLVLNMALKKQWPHVGAYLEEVPNAKNEGLTAPERNS